MRVLSALQNLAFLSFRYGKIAWVWLYRWVNRRLDGLSLKWRRRLSFLTMLLFVAVAALFARPTAMQALGRVTSFSEYKAIWSQNEPATLDNIKFPGGRLFQWVRDTLPEDAKFLIYRQAEFSYYVDQDWVYDFDPKLINLYDVGDKKSAHDFLIEQGIDYIFVPNYMTATLYNSTVINLIGDPAYTRELYSNSGMRVYEVYKKYRPWKCETAYNIDNWVQGIIGSRPTFEAGGNGLFGPSPKDSAPRTFTDFQAKGGPIFRLDRSPFGVTEIGDGEIMLIWLENYPQNVGVLSGFGPLYLPPEKTFDPEKVNSIQMSFAVKGVGFLELWIYEFAADGGRKARRLWDVVLSDETTLHEYSIHAGLEASTVSYRILINNGGSAGGMAVIKGLRDCTVSYENELSETPAPLHEVQNNNRTTIIDWDLTPVASHEQLREQGTRLVFGSNCQELSVFCSLLSVSGAARNLIMRPANENGVEFEMPISSGFTIFTDKPQTSFRTLWQCRLGRWEWFASRSPVRDGWLEKKTLKWVRKQLPAGNRADDREAALELDIVTGKNTILSTMVMWRNAKGHKNCYYLGEKAVEHRDDKMVWKFPLPKDATNINLAIQTENQLSGFLNMTINDARITIAQPQDKVAELERAPG